MALQLEGLKVRFDIDYAAEIRKLLEPCPQKPTRFQSWIGDLLADHKLWHQVLGYSCNPLTCIRIENPTRWITWLRDYLRVYSKHRSWQHHQDLMENSTRLLALDIDRRIAGEYGPKALVPIFGPKDEVPDEFQISTGTIHRPFMNE